MINCLLNEKGKLILELAEFIKENTIIAISLKNDKRTFEKMWKSEKTHEMFDVMMNELNNLKEN